MSTFKFDVWENSLNMEIKQRGALQASASNVPERTIVPMDDKLNGVNKVSTRFGVSYLLIYSSILYSRNN